MAVNGLPLFLVPTPDVDVERLENEINVHIRWRDESWFIEDQLGRRLFSFDLPEQLFEQEGLGRRAALALKEDALSEIQATVVQNSRARVVHFVLDREWIERIRERLQLRERAGQ
jgi:hypothetical protein